MESASCCRSIRSMPSQALPRCLPTARQFPSEQLPISATYYFAAGPNGQPLPPFPFLPANFAGAPVYFIGNGQYLIDNTGVDGATAPQARSMARNSAFDLSSLPGDGGDSGGGGTYTNSYVPYTFPTNGLWLQITNVANELAYLNLMNATNYVYEILSTTDLSATNWTIELEVFPTNASVMPFTVPQFGRTNLFLWAMDWTGVTENENTTPDWWFWLYFGTVALSDTNLDSQGANTLLSDYQSGIDPNVISFALVVTNNYVGNPGVPVQLNVSQGTPGYIAVVRDDTNYMADANWQPFTGTNINANLPAAEGWHDVWIGLQGLPASATRTWQWNRFKLDLTPPQIILTGPSSTVSQNLIQLTGYSPESLSQISCDISNALGILTNQQVQVLDRFYDTNTWEFTTNTFQAFDIGLTNGLNTLTIHATDIAGNVTVTNFSVTLVSDTNAPVISLTWPQNGAQLCGTSFTVSGAMDDPSATITAMLVDTNGNTNTFTGLIERNGSFWFDSLPLTGGTNWLTLTAVDIWGNTTITNLAVSQSAITLTIDPVDTNQLYLPAINLTGTVSDSTCSIWANGVPGVNNGDGTWGATNVPVSAGGAASFYVSAYPAADTVSTNTVNPNANPSDPNSSSVTTVVDKPSRVYVESYEHTDAGFSHAIDNGLLFNDDAITASATVSWQDGIGGGGAAYMSGVQNAYYTDGPVTNTCNTAQTWPASFYPNLPAGTYSTNGCMDGGSSPPSPVTWQHVGVQTRQDCLINSFDPDYGSYQNVWHSTGQTNAQAKIKLYTGGRAYVSQQNLWGISGSATEHRITGSYYWGNTPIYQDFAVPSQKIAMGNVGQLGTDGNFYIVLPNDTTKDITPAVNGLNNYAFTAYAQTNTPYITANGFPLASSYVVANANYLVGQNISFALGGLTNGETATNFHWTLEGTYFNESNQPCTTCSTNYTKNTNLLSNAAITNCWWVSGRFNPPMTYTATVICDLIFNNGNAQKTYHTTGKFSMARPSAKISPVTTSVLVWTNNYGVVYLSFAQPSSNSNGITFYYTLKIPSGFSGSPVWAQVDSAPASLALDNKGTWHSAVFYVPGPYLDTSYPYNMWVGTNAVDSPDLQLSGLPKNYIAAVESDNMNMWLLFQPSGGHVVPLRVVNWWWSGYATNYGAGWGLKIGTNSVNPTDADAETYPVWYDNVTNCYWNPPL